MIASPKSPHLEVIDECKGHWPRSHLGDHVLTEMSGSIHIGLGYALDLWAFRHVYEDTYGVAERTNRYP